MTSGLTPSCYIVVLTGGIASGKSAVSDLFAELNVPIIDTDVIARDLVQPGKPALEEISRIFGEDFLLADGNLDRKKLRLLVIADHSAKKELESLLHPAILDEVNQQISALNSPYCVLVVPLFIESNNYEWVDRVLVVDANKETQIMRLIARDGVNKTQARAITEIQASRQQRLAAADDVIENFGSIDELAPKVRKLHLKYLELASQATP